MQLLRWTLITVVGAVVALAVTVVVSSGFPILSQPERLRDHSIETVGDLWLQLRPLPQATKLRVLIARLQDDQGEQVTTQISIGFKQISAIDVLDMARDLTVQRATIREDVENNAKRARGWMGLRGADLLVWGARRDGKTYLYFVTPVSSVPCKYRPKEGEVSLNEDESLPEQARRDFSEAVFQTVRSTTLPFCTEEKSFAPADLDIRLRKVQQILKSADFRFDDVQRSGLAWTFARGAGVAYRVTGNWDSAAREQFDWLLSESVYATQAQRFGELVDVATDYTLLDMAMFKKTTDFKHIFHARQLMRPIQQSPHFDGLQPSRKVLALTWAGTVALWVAEKTQSAPDYDEAVKSLQSAVDITDTTSLNDAGLKKMALNGLGRAQLRLGTIASDPQILLKATSILNRAHDLCDSKANLCDADEAAHIANDAGIAWFTLGTIRRLRSDFESAIRFFQISVIRFQQIGNMRAVAAVQVEILAAREMLEKLADPKSSKNAEPANWHSFVASVRTAPFSALIERSVEEYYAVYFRQDQGD